MHFLNQGYHLREAYLNYMQEIKRKCSLLAHLPASNIRVRYRDEDGYMINLWEDSSGFSFGEMLRSAKEVKERDNKEIFLLASEIDSPLPSKMSQMRRTDLGTDINIKFLRRYAEFGS